MGRLDNRVAVVAGGATGIGLDTASRLAADGATAVIASRDTTRGEAAAEAIRTFGGRTTFIMTDVIEDSQVAALAKRAAAEGDGIGIWFNNAGVEGGLGPLGAFDDLTMRQLLDTNVKGVYSGMRYAAEHMRAGGADYQHRLLRRHRDAGAGRDRLRRHQGRGGVDDQGGGARAGRSGHRRRGYRALDHRHADDRPAYGFHGPGARAASAAQFNPSGKLASREQVAEVVAGLADRTRPYRSGDVLLVDAGPSVTIMQ